MQKKRPPDIVGGPFEVKGQNGAWALAPGDSTVASELDAGACGSGSPRSSLRYNIRANRPRSDLRGLGLLAFAVRLLVGRADEAAFDEDMSAFLDVRENSLSQARAKTICYVESDLPRIIRLHCNAVTVWSVFP
jgi:hypothetical protein